MIYWILAVVVGIAVFAAWITWEIIHAPLIKDFPLLWHDIDGFDEEDKEDEDKETKEKHK